MWYLKRVDASMDNPTVAFQWGAIQKTYVECGAAIVNLGYDRVGGAAVFGGQNCAANFEQQGDETTVFGNLCAWNPNLPQCCLGESMA